MSENPNATSADRRLTMSWRIDNRRAASANTDEVKNMTTRPNNLPGVRDYDEVHQGWPRVMAALRDRLPWSSVPGTVDSWQMSRFTPSIALAFICDHDVLSPACVEAWQVANGLDHP